MKIPETYEDFLAATPEEISSYHVTYCDSEMEEYQKLIGYKVRLRLELREKYPYDVATRLYNEKLGIKENNLDFPDDFEWNEPDDEDENVIWGSSTPQGDDSFSAPTDLIETEEKSEESKEKFYAAIRLYNSKNAFYDIDYFGDVIATTTIHDGEFGNIEYKPEKLNYGPPGLSATLDLMNLHYRLEESKMGLVMFILVNYVTSEQIVITQKGETNEQTCEFYINDPKTDNWHKHEFFCNKETGIYLGDLKSYAKEMGLADKDEEYIRSKFDSDSNYRILYRDYIDELILEFNSGRKNQDIVWENSSLRPMMIEINA